MASIRLRPLGLLLVLLFQTALVSGHLIAQRAESSGDLNAKDTWLQSVREECELAFGETSGNKRGEKHCRTPSPDPFDSLLGAFDVSAQLLYRQVKQKVDQNEKLQCSDGNLWDQSFTEVCEETGHDSPACNSPTPLDALMGEADEKARKSWTDLLQSAEYTSCGKYYKQLQTGFDSPNVPAASDLTYDRESKSGFTQEAINAFCELGYHSSSPSPSPFPPSSSSSSSLTKTFSPSEPSSLDMTLHSGPGKYVTGAYLDEKGLNQPDWAVVIITTNGLRIRTFPANAVSKKDTMETLLKDWNAVPKAQSDGLIFYGTFAKMGRAKWEFIRNTANKILSPDQKVYFINSNTPVRGTRKLEITKKSVSGRTLYLVQNGPFHTCTVLYTHGESPKVLGFKYIRAEMAGAIPEDGILAQMPVYPVLE